MNSSVQCSKCNAVAQRVPRRRSDKAISLFYPLKRYRCSKIDCGQEAIVGNAHYVARFLRLMNKAS